MVLRLRGERVGDLFSLIKLIDPRIPLKRPGPTANFAEREHAHYCTIVRRCIARAWRGVVGEYEGEDMLAQLLGGEKRCIRPRLWVRARPRCLSRRKSLGPIYGITVCLNGQLDGVRGMGGLVVTQSWLAEVSLRRICAKGRREDEEFGSSRDGAESLGGVAPRGEGRRSETWMSMSVPLTSRLASSQCQDCPWTCGYLWAGPRSDSSHSVDGSGRNC